MKFIFINSHEDRFWKVQIDGKILYLKIIFFRDVSRTIIPSRILWKEFKKKMEKMHRRTQVKLKRELYYRPLFQNKKLIARIFSTFITRQERKQEREKKYDKNPSLSIITFDGEQRYSGQLQKEEFLPHCCIQCWIEKAAHPLSRVEERLDRLGRGRLSMIGHVVAIDAWHTRVESHCSSCSLGEALITPPLPVYVWFACRYVNYARTATRPSWTIRANS